MTRDGSAASFTASQAEHIRTVYLAELLFDSGPVRACTADRSIHFAPDGGSPQEEFLGVGNLGGISAIEETSDFRPTLVELLLTGIPAEFIALAFEKAQGRRGRLWIGFLDEDYALINAPVLLFEGLMDNAEITLGASGSVKLPINNRIIEWQRAKVIRYTNEDQLGRFAGDKFFEFVQQTTEKELLWGVGSTDQVPRAPGVAPPPAGERREGAPILPAHIQVPSQSAPPNPAAGLIPKAPAQKTPANPLAGILPAGHPLLRK